MKKTLLLLLILSVEAFAQTAPSGYTTNYRIRKWASGANPGADSLNANWSLIDSMLQRPKYTYQDSLIIGATSSPSSLRMYVNGVANIVGNTTVGGTLTADTVNGSIRLTGPIAVNGTVSVDTLSNPTSTLVVADSLNVVGTVQITGLLTSIATQQWALYNLAQSGVGRWRFSYGASLTDKAYIDSTGTFAAGDGGNFGTLGDSASAKSVYLYSHDGAYVTNDLTVSNEVIAATATLSGDLSVDSIYATSGIRTQGDVWKATTAYTNPDYVFQDFYTGESVNPDYEGLRPLSEIEAHTKANHRLPGIKDEPTGIFSRADFLLENVEKLYLYVIAQDKELKRLRAEVEALKGR